MSERSVEKRIRRWTKGANPLPYWFHQRLADWWHATRDARSSIPARLVTADGEPVRLPEAELSLRVGGPVDDAHWATPRTIFLGQLGRGRAEREWVRYQAEVADSEVQRAQVEALLAVAREQLQAAEARLAGTSSTPSPEQTRVAAPGEEGATAEVRAGRRAREHAAARGALEAEVRQSRAKVEETSVELARLQEPVRIRRQVAEVRVAMIEAYVRRRCSAYLTRLVRKHPEGGRIGPLIRSGWAERPSWLDREPAARSGGAR